MEAITHGRRERFQLMKYQQYQKACGMTVVLNKQKVLKDGTIVNITEEQYIPPDTNAAEFVSRHDDPDYIPPKAEQSNNNAVVFFQLPQIQAEINKIRDELKSLETVEVKVIE
jgi:hypothetical protein